MSVERFLAEFDELEIQEHLTDMNLGGDNSERIAYYTSLIARFMHSIYVWIGNDPIGQRLLDPWDVKEEKPKVELPDMKVDDPLREALKRRIEMTSSIRSRKDGQ